ncbi:MAG: tetratricopeptide repeat protein [Burkholderiales bacterium]
MNGLTGRMLSLVVCAAGLMCPVAGWAQIEQARAAFDKEDFAAAYKLYKPSAEQGTAEAQYRVGLMHKFGWGTERDHSVAARWFAAAVEQSHAEAQFELGIYYKDGRGVARDMAKSAALFLKASEQGVGIAQLNLGRYFLAGTGVAKDPVAAYYWLTAAAQNGYMDGMALRVPAAEEMTPEQIKETSARAKQAPRKAN